MAAVAAGLTTGPLDVGVAVAVTPGVMLLLKLMLPAAGSIGVLESPAADNRLVVEGRGSSDSLAAAASTGSIWPGMCPPSPAKLEAPNDARLLPTSVATSFDMRLLNVSAAAPPAAADGLETGGGATGAGGDGARWRADAMDGGAVKEGGRGK